MVKKVLVIGDVIVDEYRYCSAKKLANDRPVPVLIDQGRELRLGGAGAVAAMCRELGLDVDLVGVTGTDFQGMSVPNLCHDRGIRWKGVSCHDCRTLHKLRYFVGNHLVLQVDDPEDLKREALISRKPDLKDWSQYDGAIVSDYNKGTLSGSVLPDRLDGSSIPVIVDPCQYNGYSWMKYAGATVIVPNRYKTSATHLEHLIRSSGSEVIVMTDGAHGVHYISRTTPNEVKHVPARKSVEIDPTGASDQFIAALMYARLNPDYRNLQDELKFASIAAGMQVERLGCVPVPLTEIDNEYCRED